MAKDMCYGALPIMLRSYARHGPHIRGELAQSQIYRVMPKCRTSCGPQIVQPKSADS
jgi:hypothetical protein